MKFDLFLSDINQEMIDAGRIRIAAGGWDGNLWSKACCIINFSKRPRDVGDPEPFHAPQAEGLLLRSEEGGGLAWSPRTNAVYKLDEAGYRVLLAYDAGHSEHAIADITRNTPTEVSTFLADVRTKVRS